MWYLISSHDPDTKYVILGGKVLTIGRRDCDVQVAGDGTVSRKHAQISISHAEVNLTNVNRLPVLKLTDLSKFGTWVNDEKINQEKLLSDGDTVYFGSPKSSFMVVYEPLVVTSSCLDNAAKKSVRQSLCTLGGHMVNEWTNSCSLLIMSKISVTIKVISALVSQKWVVTPHYLEVYAQSLQGQKDKPDPTRFTPELAETQLNPNEVTFNPDPRRSSLFKGMTFVFLSPKQFKKMHLAIELAGGMTLLMDKPCKDEELLAAGTLVMTCAEPGLSEPAQNWVMHVQQLLDSHGKHMIADAEIGYAVLYCSTAKHCNPDFSQSTDLSRLPSQSLSQVEPFVPNTETQNRTQTGRPSMVINETRHSQLPGGSERSKQGTSKSTVTAVKEEKTPIPSHPQSGKKRSRKVTAEDEEAADAPVAAASKRIKTEPVTPVKSSTPGANRLTNADKSSSDKDQQAIEWDSDEGIDYTKINDTPNSKINRNSRKTSPKSKKSALPFSHEDNQSKKKKETKKRQAIVIEDDDIFSDDEVDYSSIDIQDTSVCEHAENKSSKKTSNRKSVSPVSDKRKKVEQSMTSSRKRSRSRSKSPAPKANDVTVKTEVITPEKRGQHRSRTGDKAGSSSEANVPVLKRERDDAEYENSMAREQKSAIHLTAVPSGFLTTRQPIQNQVARHRDYEPDQDLPVGCVQTEVVSLVARQPKNQSRQEHTGQCPKGYTRWKGKVVRNFKKFKKTEHSGSQSLPKIIGGSDLEVHNAKRSKELDDWFRESLQAESQHTAEEKRANELFNFEPKRRGR